jgi:hypothetical protein
MKLLNQLNNQLRKNHLFRYWKLRRLQTNTKFNKKMKTRVFF